jgi:hypothetical protein
MQENAASHTTDLLNKMAPKVGINFPSEAKAYSFYNKYYTKMWVLAKNPFITIITWKMWVLAKRQ